MCQLRVSYEVRQLRHLETNVRRETCGYVYTVASGRAFYLLIKFGGTTCLVENFYKVSPLGSVSVKNFSP